MIERAAINRHTPAVNQAMPSILIRALWLEVLCVTWESLFTDQDLSYRVRKDPVAR